MKIEEEECDNTIKEQWMNNDGGVRSAFVASILETSENIDSKINIKERVLVKKTPMMHGNENIPSQIHTEISCD